jgi:hypothetical protein
MLRSNASKVMSKPPKKKVSKAKKVVKKSPKVPKAKKVKRGY